ncbi:hypothetical protein MNBD_PLANCTO02-2981 [hydrothermal vent metagenome]|uniref:Uncharacterized protein n=1 Tax=hydrothermal vent metagenome TaxID=652676 RepID=A0A3B1DCH1_9ZZZZ
MNTSLLTGSETNLMSDVDAIEEMRLRTWARKNYAPADERHEDWHPIIRDEMKRIDGETK